MLKEDHDTVEDGLNAELEKMTRDEEHWDAKFNLLAVLQSLVLWLARSGSAAILECHCVADVRTFVLLKVQPNRSQGWVQVNPVRRGQRR